MHPKYGTEKVSSLATRGDTQPVEKTACPLTNTLRYSQITTLSGFLSQSV